MNSWNALDTKRKNTKIRVTDANPHFMFNIQENENETTGNCVDINIKEKIKQS
jgi:hypothetical protein